MRIDVITIFPEYLAPLELSLIGRARRDGLVVLQVHDLRSWTHDRHRTVDDTPLGGGAGMVMKPEPWAEAFAGVRQAGQASLGGDVEPLIVFPNPAGTPFAQATAQEWSQCEWIIFACGRYEGIDERVYEHLLDIGCEVALASLGDYVLNGGEVAVLAITEAVVRLVPGVVGNAAALVEESHSACSNTRSTPGPRAGPIPPGCCARRRRSCSPATTGRSPPGVVSSRCSARGHDARICSRGRRRPAEPAA